MIVPISAPAPLGRISPGLERSLMKPGAPLHWRSAQEFVRLHRLLACALQLDELHCAVAAGDGELVAGISTGPSSPCAAKRSAYTYYSEVAAGGRLV